MATRVILLGSVGERADAERLLWERFPELHVESVAGARELVSKACEGEFDVAAVLRGPIVEHEARIEAVASLRRNGFGGRIVYAGAFLTEKQDAITAGADYVFDPDKQTVESVVKTATLRPRLAADHPYLRYLFVGEWAAVEGFAGEPPEPAPDVLIASTSSHSDEAFYARLAAFSKAHPETRCLLVEDNGGEDVEAAALASGVQPYVVAAEEGLKQVLALGRRFLRDRWLERVSAA